MEKIYTTAGVHLMSSKIFNGTMVGLTFIKKTFFKLKRQQQGC